jgi:hypothetical protein
VAVETLDALKASMFAEHFQYWYTLTLRLQRLERDRRNDTLSASRMAAPHGRHASALREATLIMRR